MITHPPYIAVNTFLQTPYAKDAAQNTCTSWDLRRAL